MSNAWRTKVVKSHKAAIGWSGAEVMFEMTLVSDKDVKILLHQMSHGLIIKACGTDVASPTSYTVCGDPKSPDVGNFAYVLAVIKDGSPYVRPRAISWEQAKKAARKTIERNGVPKEVLEIFNTHAMALAVGIADEDRVKRLDGIVDLIKRTPDLDEDELVQLLRTCRVAEVSDA